MARARGGSFSNLGLKVGAEAKPKVENSVCESFNQYAKQRRGKAGKQLGASS